MIYLALMGASLAGAGPTPMPGWLARVADRPAEYALDDVWVPQCPTPCAFRGFSFTDAEDELRLMREAGANTVGDGRMWIPVKDASAPYGMGVQPYREALSAGVPLAQTFRAERPFSVVAAHTPTYVTRGSGATLRLLSLPAGGGPSAGTEVAQVGLRDVADNALSALRFAEQPPGDYAIELSEPTGERIGWWAARGDVYADGCAWVRGARCPTGDFELAIGPDVDHLTWLVASTPDHVAIELARDPLEVLDSLGMRLVFMVGDWNNGGFPYYPRWFYDEFPDITMVDASGAPVLAGMFGEEFGWPAIDHPVIADGGARHVRQLVGELRDEPAVLYWVLGGEALYSTYLQAGRWTDYAPNAQAHFRAWLERRYRRIDALNESWGTRHASFAEAEMPRGPAFSVPWSDFLDFRFSAMAERFAWHYQAVRARDRSRLALTCNHGDLYHGDWYAAMGARPEWYASSADGFETGQIMFGSDPDYFNLLYMESLASFGKPICPNRLAYKFPDPKARGGGTSFTPEAARRYLTECLGWGNWHVGVVQWRGDLPDGEWGVKGTKGLTEIERVFDEWARTDADRLHMRALKPKVAVYLSNQTWSLRGFRPDWNRLHNSLVRHQIPVVYLYDSQLSSGRLDGTDVIVSIGNEVLPDACRAALQRFVARGGRLVCQGAGAVYDQWLRPYSGDPWPDGAIWSRDTAAPGVADVDAVVRAVEALRPDAAVSPWVLDDGGATVTEQRVTATVASHNWPLDLAGHASVEQTFRVLGGAVRAVAACIPTFNHPQGVFGLTLEVRRGGPQGELLGSRIIAAGDIADNAWCTVGLDRPLPAGEEATLILRPDAGTTPLNLGVWAAAEDCYADGSLSIDGQPAPGDLELQLTWDAEVAASEPVEAFCLSDGLSLLGVFVNTAGVPVSVTVAADGRVVPDPRGRYAVRAIPDGAALGTCRGDSLSFPLALAPHGSAMVLCERVTGEGDGSQAVAWAARVVAGLRGAGMATPYQEYLAAQAARLAERAEWSRAAACAGELTRQLGLRVSESSPGRRYRVRVVDLAGRPVEGAGVTADFVPTEGFTRDLEPLGGGEYRLRLRPDELPARYDYAARRYVTFSGPLRLTLTARHNGRRGQVFVDTVCP